MTDKKPSPEFCLQKIDQIKKEIEAFDNVTRKHQLFQAESAHKYADIFYRTYFLFNTGAFVILPTYYQFFKTDNSELNFSIFISIITGLLTSAFIMFISLISAYLSSSAGAYAEINKSEHHSYIQWKDYFSLIKDTRQENDYATKEENSAKHINSNEKIRDRQVNMALNLAILALFLFFISSYSALYYAFL